jgi:glycogen synthase
MSRRRHIMMTADAVGGVWTYATMLARALVQGGDHVTLVTLGPEPRADQLAEIAHHRAIDLVVTDLTLEWMDPAGVDHRRASEMLLSLARKLKPDVVHLNGFREGAFAWPAPALVVAHSCVTSWWQFCRGGQLDEPRWRAYARSVDHGLRAADAWVAPTAAFARTIEAIYAPPTSGIVIHNGIERLSARRIAKDEVILASGRVWDLAKNLDAVLAVAPRIAWPIEIAGPTAGPNGEIVACRPNAVFLGELARAQLLDGMRRAAIYVAPARYEPFGLGVLEAAAGGCALVLADIATMRELWDGTAIFVDPDDRDALADALNLLCDDAQVRSELAAAAAHRARCYTIAATAKKYSALYDAMLGHAGSAPSRREARA